MHYKFSYQTILAIVLSVLLRYMNYASPFGIYQLFWHQKQLQIGHLKQPPINIRVVNCMKDRSPQRSPNLTVCVMHLMVSTLHEHDGAWIKRATLIYWTAYDAILLFDWIWFPINLLLPLFFCCVNCKFGMLADSI